jgi:Glycosyl hydrolase family 79, N-terminal domain
MSASSVSVSFDVRRPGEAIPCDFLGLSFESQLLLPGARGRRYFRADDYRLIQLFKTLGIRNLRIGGNTSDNPAVQIPGPDDIDSLFAFARAAGVKVIYGLRLRGLTDGEAAAPIAKYIMDRYAADLDSFAIGNEPSIYVKTYADYREKLRHMISAITAAAPEAIFCGPSEFSGDWIRNFADDFQSSGRLKSTTCHLYAGLNARDVNDAATARQRILSRDFVALYDKFRESFAPHVLARKMPYRVGETNSFYNGGAKDVSDTFAASLWGLDYLYWWASHGAAGLNFHTGDQVAAGDDSTPCRYAVYWSTPNGYDVHPLGYAVKAFDLGCHGRMLKVNVDSPDRLNLPVYGVLGEDDSVYLTLVHKEHAPAGRYASVHVNCGEYRHGSLAYLTAPGGDLAATSNIKLGEAAIGHDGDWNGVWKRLPSPDAAGGITLELPLATAAVVRLARQ